MCNGCSHLSPGDAAPSLLVHLGDPPPLNLGYRQLDRPHRATATLLLSAGVQHSELLLELMMPYLEV
jgi:hypothetical protein